MRGISHRWTSSSRVWHTTQLQTTSDERAMRNSTECFGEVRTTTTAFGLSELGAVEFGVFGLVQLMQ